MKNNGKVSDSASAVEPSENNEQTKDNNGEQSGSSSDSLYEIRLNECVRKSEISDFDIRALVVRCSSCGRQINHHIKKEVRRHRKLNVITCKECYEFYGSSEFSQDENGYNYCTWCGNGGKLVVCDFCPNGFCSACIRRNFGRAEISFVNTEGWKCYCCDRKRLKPKVKFCDLVVRCNENSKKERAVPKEKKSKTLSEPWLQAVFDESEEACKKFHRKMDKLKSIGLSKSKSLKHLVKKIEEMINNHKTDLKNISNEFTKVFESRLEKQWKEQESNENNSDSDVLIIEKKKLHLSNDIVRKEEENEVVSDSIISTVTSDRTNVAKEEEKINAKLKLLNSSSDSDGEKLQPLVMGECLVVRDEEHDKVVDAEKEETADIDMLEVNRSDDEKVKNVSDLEKETKKVINSHDESEQKANSHDELKEKTNSNDESKTKAKRRLSFSFSSASSDSDFHVVKPNFEEIDLEENSHSSSSHDDKKHYEKKIANLVDPDTDKKLKMEPKVDIIRCDSLLKNGETSVIIANSEVSDLDEKLDRMVDRLCQVPRFKQKTKTNVDRRPGPKSKALAKKKLMESSSSSISLSSEEDENQKKIVIAKKSARKEKNLHKKKESSDSSNSDDSSSLVSVDDDDDSKSEKKKKQSKAAKKESDSSDDFVPMRKRRYDKLLHAKISSDEEKKSREKKSSRKRKVLSSEEEKNERRRKDSNSSTATSSSEDSRSKKGRKRRRIKSMGSSSDDEDGTQDKDTPGKGRKNIRKILSRGKVAESTKEAQLEEKERRRRILERQKLYNKIEDMTDDGQHVITRKMVLEVDQDSKEEIVEIHPDLVCKLKPHQVNGVKFMWECTIESVKDLDKPGSGCILAHCMGLGKTLQVIAFLHTCLTNKIVGKQITTGMIICPYNTVLNWASEFEYWLNDVECDIKVHQIAAVKSNLERLDILEYWYKEGGVVILSYDIFRRLSQTKIPKFKAREKKKLQEYLLDPGPDIVVCDEGHVLKNDKSAISVATTKLRTRRRIVLTGTPLQNNLKEYHCMLSFVKPNLLGTNKEFRNRFVNPIINGQYDDSNDYDVKLMKKRIHILHKLLEGCVQRCDYSALTQFLPPKHEFVISVKLSEVQMNMYECYLDKIRSGKKDIKNAGSTLFIDFNNLRCIWTHPYICHTSHERSEFKKLFKEDDEEEENFINDESEEASTSTHSETSDDDKLLKQIDEDRKRKDYRTRSKVGENEESEEEETPEINKQWYHEFISDEDKYNVQLSGKMVLLLEILKECEVIRDKLLLFSQSLLALDAIEDILNYVSTHTLSEEEASIDRIGTWVKGIDYFRMDGSTSADFRKSFIDMFNDSSNERARLFLISTRAGSLGTNLVGANRVIIFDTSWNPSHDVQAIFRVYRFGQIKPVYIYRFLAQGTMEEKIYDRQVTKLSLSCRVVDEQQIDRHFSAADLAELYTFDRNSTTNRPTPMVPNDRLLAEMLIRNKEWIVTYHEHDSLLQNQTEEDLTEEERRSAWTEYENEREGRTFAATAAAELTNIESLTTEPDFNEDYEGRKVPELNMLIEVLTERLKRENPTLLIQNKLEFQKKLLSNVRLIRQAFQERHVEVLRKKQEYCSMGTVPNSLNKYLDEVSRLLVSSSQYVNKLALFVNNEELKRKQTQAQFQAQAQAQAQAAQAGAQQIRNFQYLQRMQHIMRARMQRQNTGNRFPPQPFLRPDGSMQFVFRPPTATYSRAQTAKQPVVTITEIDDNEPEPPAETSSGPTNSTVVIEEIT